MVTNDTNQQPDPSDRNLDEILAELMRAVDAGQSVEPNEWLERYPDFAADIKEYFEKQKRMERLVLPLRRNAAQMLNVRCPHCHNPIELLEDARLEEVSCPSCGSSFSLVGEKTVSHYSPGEKTIGHFQLLDRVGIGAFGTVWKARDTQLDRIVALKIPRNTQLDESQTELFLRDARAASQLKHPNIVSVHEVGKQDDTIYIVSDFIQGTNLKEWTDTKRLTPREAAELCIKIAKALHHAHESGVIHRDMKPGNIMMDADGEPHIVDFGLAKREAGEITMTVEGQILGTPAYMSPEQARGEGHTVDRRADIYSLGVILFELMTGELPFRGDKQMLIVQVLKDDPPSPRKLNGGVPRDLDTICLKCLEKEPRNRFGTTDQVANELERHLRDEPIRTRPISTLSRIWRWSRRNPKVAGLAATLAIVLAAVSVFSPIIAVYQANLRGRAEDLVVQKDQLLFKNAELVGELNTSLGEQKKATEEARQQAKLAELGAYNMQLARVDEVLRYDPGQAKRLLEDSILCPPELKDFTWGLLQRMLSDMKKKGSFPRLTSAIMAIAFSPDGKLLATVDRDNIRLWNVATHEPIMEIAGDFEGVRIVSFSPDGSEFISGDGKDVKVWDLRTKQVRLLEGHLSNVICVAFSPNGQLLATGAYGGGLRLWDLAVPGKSRKLKGHTHNVWCVDFSPDGRMLASASHDGSLRLWNPTSGDEIATLIEDTTNDYITHVAFSADGSILYSAGADGVKQWNLESRQVSRCGPADEKHVTMTASADRKVLAFNARHSVFLWNPQRDTSRMILSADRPPFGYALALSNDGQFLATASSTDPIQIWRLKPKQESLVFSGHTDIVYSLAFSPDGETVVSAGLDRDVRLWSTSTGEAIAVLKGHARNVRCVAFSPDGALVATGEGRGAKVDSPAELKVWDVHTARESVASLESHFGGIESLVFSPDGRILASAGVEGSVKLRDVTTGQTLASLPVKASCMSFLHHGKTLLTATSDEIALWSVPDGIKQASHHGVASPLACSADGTLIACRGDDHAIEIWDWARHQKVACLEGHTDHVDAVTFSPDGKTIASGGWDRTIRLWDPTTGQQRLTLEDKHRTEVNCVAFSPDGRMLGSAGHDATVKVWRAAEFAK